MIASCLAVVVTWSAAGADPALFGWGAGARATLRALRSAGGKLSELKEVLVASPAGLTEKVYR